MSQSKSQNSLFSIDIRASIYLKLSILCIYKKEDFPNLIIIRYNNKMLGKIYFSIIKHQNLFNVRRIKIELLFK